MSWHEAQKYAASLSLGGKRDWRLPSLAELETYWQDKRVQKEAPMREEVPFRDELPIGPPRLRA